MHGTHQRKAHRPVPEVGSACMVHIRERFRPAPEVGSARYTSEKDSGLHLRLAVHGTHQRRTQRPAPEVGNGWYTSEKDSQACT